MTIRFMTNLIIWAQNMSRVSKQI